MALTPQQELEIYPLLDRVSDLEPKQGILYKCSVRRADYLVRMIQGLRYDSAIESIQTYPQAHPLYGQGLYALLWIEVQERGLLLTKLTSPHDSAMWRIIQCAATRTATPLPPETNFHQVRARLLRAQKKHAKIMNNLYITDRDDLMIQYGEPGEEELVIVDIDLEPGYGVLDPTPEQEAKQEAETPYKKSR